MSLPIVRKDVRFFQRILAVSGHYTGPLDGKWTAAVDAAERAFNAETLALRTQLGAFDARSERNIETLVPGAQRLARLFLRAAAGFPFEARTSRAPGPTPSRTRSTRSAGRFRRTSGA